MNWSCVMVGGIFVWSTVYYIVWGRYTYTPPNETIDDYIEDISSYDVGKTEASAMHVEEKTVEVDM
jgi:hypothetical protein